MSLKIRRGTNAERLTVTPAEGELIYTTDTKELYIGDGTTVGGKLVTSSGGGGGGGTGYTGSEGSAGYAGSASTEVGYTGSKGPIGYTGSIPDGPYGYIGSFKGSYYSSTGTLIYNSSTNRINADTIRGVTFTEVNVGGPTVPNTLNVYGGPRRNISVYGTVDGTFSNIPFIEIRSSRGSLSSPAVVQDTDIVSAFKSTGWNGSDYADLAGILFKSTSLASLTSQSGEVLLYSIDTNGDAHFLEFNDFGDLIVENGIRTTALSSAPASPIVGTIYTANGVDWDPASKSGSVPYPVFYDGVSYNSFY